MTKAFILSESDFDRLLTLVDRDPKHGRDGGSCQSSVRSPKEEKIYEDVYEFYNYQVRKWIDEVSR